MSGPLPPPPPPPPPPGSSDPNPWSGSYQSGSSDPNPWSGSYQSGPSLPGPPPPGYGYPPNPAYRTNGLAIGALVSALVFAPLGIILGHVALGQIRRRGEGGRGLAVAALAIGYLWVAMIVLGTIAVMYIVGVNPMSNLASDALDDETSYPRTTSYYTTTTVPVTSDATTDVIVQAAVGDCLHTVQGADLGDGTSAITVSRAQCGTTYATGRVVRKTDNTAACGSFDWVRAMTANRWVVLCVVEE